MKAFIFSLSAFAICSQAAMALQTEVTVTNKGGSFEKSHDADFLVARLTDSFSRPLLQVNSLVTPLFSDFIGKTIEPQLLQAYSLNAVEISDFVKSLTPVTSLFIQPTVGSQSPARTAAWKKVYDSTVHDSRTTDIIPPQLSILFSFKSKIVEKKAHLFGGKTENDNGLTVWACEYGLYEEPVITIEKISWSDGHNSSDIAALQGTELTFNLAATELKYLDTTRTLHWKRFQEPLEPFQAHCKDLSERDN